MWRVGQKVETMAVRMVGQWVVLMVGVSDGSRVGTLAVMTAEKSVDQMAVKMAGWMDSMQVVLLAARRVGLWAGERGKVLVDLMVVMLAARLDWEEQWLHKAIQSMILQNIHRGQSRAGTLQRLAVLCM